MSSRHGRDRTRSQSEVCNIYGFKVMVELERVEVKCPVVGDLVVFTQGSGDVPIITVHDLGCNHEMWLELTQNPSMEKIMQRAKFHHVVLPGMEDNASDLPPTYSYPTMQLMAEGIMSVLDHFGIQQAVLVGEGAGANILARTALKYPARVFGLVLIHCTGTTAGFMENMKDKLLTWKLDAIGMNPSAEAYLVLHRFGSFENASNREEIDRIVANFYESLRKKINPRNLKQLINAFLRRTNITDSMKNLKVPVLFVTGEKASFNHTVHTLFTATILKIEDRRLVDFLEVANVSNVVAEQPEKFSESFQYFLQGIGLISSLPMSNLGKTGVRPRRGTMEEHDRPRKESFSSTSSVEMAE